MGKEFEIRRTNPGDGPVDGVECTTNGVRSILPRRWPFGKKIKQKEIKVNIKASHSLGVVSVSDQEKGQMIIVSIAEMAAVLNSALKE